MGLEVCVGQLVGGCCCGCGVGGFGEEREQGEKAKFESLCVVQSGEVGGCWDGC